MNSPATMRARSRPLSWRLSPWEAKIAANQARDTRKQAELEALGWEALVVWQCETGDATALEKSLRTFLGPPSKSDRQSPEDRLALKKRDNNNQ